MNDSSIPTRWLPFIRAAWLVLVLLLLAIFIAGITPYYNELRLPCSAADCELMALSPQEAQALQNMGLSLEFYAGYQVGTDIYATMIFIPLAGLIFWRKSDTWMGLLVSLLLVFFSTATALNTDALVDQYPILQQPFFLLDFLATLLIVLLVYLFPDGRFVPRWTCFVAIAFAVGLLIDLLLSIRDPLRLPNSVGSEIFGLSGFLGGVLAQIYRYRRVSTPTQRQQTKWVMFGLIIWFITTLAWVILYELSPPQSVSTRVALNLGAGILILLLTVFPLSVALSILRYRLWDIDIIINRTLVYALLSAILVAIYFTTVVLLQSLLTASIGQRSPLAIVISTLLIAALFAPLRRRLQELIDRRFYRRKYDAEKQLARFAASARDEVDLEVLAAALINVVNETLQPAATFLWLAPSQYPGGNRPANRDSRNTESLNRNDM